MLTPWGRVLTRTAGALPFLPAYRTVIPVGQFIPRGLATATASKKTTATATKAAKAPVGETATTSTTTKKAAPKTAVANQKTAAAKEKTAAKDAETAEKPGRKPKKTDEEKQKEHVRALLERALDPPEIPTKSAWVYFLKEKFEGNKGTGEGVAKILQREHASWSNEYKNLTPAQLEALQNKAASVQDSKQQALQDWVKQHSPAEIHQANLARAALRLIKARADPVPRGLKGSRFSPIPDSRYPLRARTANILYVKDKFATLPKEKRVDALPTLMKEFTALPEAEKQKWRELSAQDVIRYHNELRNIGIEPASASA
ncbi:hypothetical protein EV426DRAFT_718447 [Tirmania nivea]|nr:hypothetical protein EV426DRAFT_718447 [Tirmania nivea]